MTLILRKVKDKYFTTENAEKTKKNLQFSVFSVFSVVKAVDCGFDPGFTL